MAEKTSGIFGKIIIAALVFYVASQAISLINPWLVTTLSEDPLPPDAYPAGIQPLTIETLKDQIHDSTRPTMLVLFASWCGYCRQELPLFEALQKQGIAPVDFIFISIDKDLDALANYRRKSAPAQTWWHLPRHDMPAFRNWLAAHGGQYKGGIPYSALFTPDEKMIAEIPGFVDKAAAEAFFHQLQQRITP